jgi:mono/diheme cytochrome c family protein
MAIYQGAMFPKAWRNGAFIAFHGSWNRAPAPQGGYTIVFQPLADGKANGPWLVFADGFAGGVKDPGGAAHRPTGLAVAPDGALYIADDKNGRIWRVTYRGDPDAPLQAAAAADVAAAAARPPLSAPKGVPAARLARGDAVFHGEAGGTCAGCHGADGAGSANGADLVSGAWLWSKGDLGGIRRIIAKGVAQPKQHTGAMPPMGGAKLSPADLDAVAAYVWAISRDKR